MRKQDIVKAIAGRTGITKAEVQDIIEAFIDKVAGHLTRGERIELRGFGGFEVRRLNSRTIFIPRLSQRRNYLPCVRPRFKASKILTKKVNHVRLETIQTGMPVSK